MSCGTRRKRKGRRGYLTVFLSLSLTVLLSVFLVTVEGARMTALRTRADMAAEISVHAAFSEFHKKMHERYDLFFVDTSYGTGVPSAENTGEHFRDYLEKNLSATGVPLFSDRRDFLSAEVTSAEVTACRMIGDFHCRALREQITAYMSAEPVGEKAAEVLQLFHDWTGTGGNSSAEEWERAQQQNAAAIRETQTVTVEHEDGSTEEIALSNPVGMLDGFRFRPALMQVLGGTTGVSENRVTLSELPSSRTLLSGRGEPADNTHGYRQADEVLFDLYIMEKCGNYRQPKKDGALRYQAEYILFGKASDEENLEKMAGRLLLVRNAANCACIFMDAEKVAEAEAAALAVAAVVAMPALMPVVRTAILLAWAYLESVVDVQCLFDGGRVPLLKTPATWKTSLSAIFSPASVRGKKGEGSGLSYTDYLHIFLLPAKADTKNLRLLDVMESDIRLTGGNGAFRIDGCLDELAVTAAVQSGFGYTLTTKASYSYN